MRKYLLKFYIPLPKTYKKDKTNILTCLDTCLLCEDKVSFRILFFRYSGQRLK